jgi:hypothetical protein
MYSVEDKYDNEHEQLAQPLPNFYCHFAIPVGSSSASQEEEWTIVPSVYLYFWLCLIQYILDVSYECHFCCVDLNYHPRSGNKILYPVMA